VGHTSASVLLDLEKDKLRLPYARCMSLLSASSPLLCVPRTSAPPQVGQTYYISKGTLKPAQRQYNHCKSDYELTLNSDSSIVPCPDRREHPADGVRVQDDRGGGGGGQQRGC